MEWIPDALVYYYVLEIPQQTHPPSYVYSWLWLDRASAFAIRACTPLSPTLCYEAVKQSFSCLWPTNENIVSATAS